MEDLIRRSDAIKAMNDAHFENYGNACIVLMYIPAVEPWELYNPDEWCRDCKEYDLERHNCPRWNRVIRNTVEENKVVNCCGCVHWVNGTCDKLNISTEDFFYCGWGEREADNEL